jgi:hypothetical protein
MRKKRHKKSKTLYSKCVLEFKFAPITGSVSSFSKKMSNSLYPNVHAARLSYLNSAIGGPARLPAQVLGDGDTKIEIVYVEEINILYWSDQSSQGRIKISCTDGTSPTNQPRKDPLHLYSISPQLPQFQQ